MIVMAGWLPAYRGGGVIIDICYFDFRKRENPMDNGDVRPGLIRLLDSGFEARLERVVGHDRDTVWRSRFSKYR